MNGLSQPHLQKPLKRSQTRPMFKELLQVWPKSRVASFQFSTKKKFITRRNEKKSRTAKHLIAWKHNNKSKMAYYTNPHRMNCRSWRKPLYISTTKRQKATTGRLRINMEEASEVTSGQVCNESVEQFSSFSLKMSGERLSTVKLPTTTQFQS